MRAKTCVVSFRPTAKNKIYLERLGFIDGRSGKLKKNPTEPIANFLNKLLTLMCETGKVQMAGKIANPDELGIAWVKFQIWQQQRAIEKAAKEVARLKQTLPETQEVEEALQAMWG